MSTSRAPAWWRSRSAPLFLAASWLSLSCTAAEVAASAATEVSVTVYRAPRMPGQSLDLDNLRGFALVSEVRTVSIPAGESRIRFEGVADGIDAASSILTGLPGGIVEKNRDARVLSPAALVAATVGRNVLLVRTDPKTGKATRTRVTLRSDAEGVVFESPAGIEALRCSGLPETFDFEAATDATATPTLSVLVRSPSPLVAKVRLSYLARGFDWMANYTATVAADGKTMDLGAWLTLANSNAVSFPLAHTQVVAGRVNRESGAVEPVDRGREILAQCWPRGSSSDTPETPNIPRAEPLWDSPFGYSLEMDAVSMLSAVSDGPAPRAPLMARMAAATLVKEEQLGDLKLYRVPERTSVNSRQIKQVRLLERHAVPIEVIYGTDIWINRSSGTFPLHEFLHTRNDSAHHLGLPLPSGQISTFYAHDAAPLLVDEGPLDDTALDEDVEIDMGNSADVQLTAHNGAMTITNARDSAATVEIGLLPAEGKHLIHADHVSITRHGHPAFRLSVPAGQSASIRYQIG